MRKTDATKQSSKDLEALYPRILFDIQDYAIYFLDKTGNILTWNKGSIQLTQFLAEEIIGKNFEILYPDQLKEKNLPEHELKEAEKNGRCVSENWRRKKDGSAFWAHNILTRVEDSDGNLAGYTNLTRDITLRKSLEEELKRKNEELKDADQNMDAFVYTASHDLKAPINNLEGLINSLYDELGDDCIKKEGIGELVPLVKTAIEKFRITINDLAFRGKVEASHKTGLDLVLFEDLLNEIKYMMIDEIVSNGVYIQSDFSQIPEVKFSRKNLRSIMMNLISNSIKYRSPGRQAHIKIKTSADQGFVVLEISDNGLGIKEEDKNKMFLMYERLHHHVEGSGVGMSIVAKIVDSSGGHIEVDSAPGEGTTFRIYFKR